MKKSVFLISAIFTVSISACQQSGGTYPQKSDASSAASNNHTISFNTDGGSYVPNQYVAHGEKIKKPENPVKLGYSFNRWTYQGEDWSFVGYVATEDMVLDAVWDLVQYKITYDLGIGGGFTTGYYTIESNYDFYIPVSFGLSFLEWTLNGEPINGISEGMTGDIVLVANWKTNFEWHEAEGQIIIDKLADQNIEHLVIDKYCSVISSGAFSNCPFLETVVLKGVGTIEENAFSNCPSLKTLSIDSVGTIGDNAFSNCTSLEYVSIESNNSIGDNAFSNCTSLKNASIKTYDMIGESIFSGCSSIESLTLSNIKTTCGLFGELFGTKKYYNSVNINQNYSYENKHFGGTYFVPRSLKTINIVDVDYVEQACFMNLFMVESISITGWLEGVEIGTFSGCISLREVSLPDSVRYLNDSAFEGCMSLTTFTLGPYMDSRNISSSAFSFCLSLIEIINKSSITQESIKKIVSCLFVISDESESCLKLDDAGFLFYEKDNQKVLVHYYGHASFVIVPEEFDIILDSAFAGCQTITCLQLSQKIKDLPSYLFFSSPYLVSLIVPSIEGLNCDNYTFLGSSIQFFYCLGEHPEWNRYTFDEIPTSYDVDSARFVESERYKYVLIDENKASSFQVIDSQVESFDFDEDFTDYPVIGIGLGFIFCKRIKTINISSDVIYFSKYYISQTVLLSSITVSDGNPRFSSIDGVLYDYNGSSLFSVPPNRAGVFVVPNGVTIISSSSFMNTCVSDISFSASVEIIEDNAFAFCEFLTTVVIPIGAKRLYAYAFYHCSSIESIDVPLTISSIGESCFSMCSSLRVLNYEGTASEWIKVSKGKYWNNCVASDFKVIYSSYNG